jgi:hypothetical protein
VQVLHAHDISVAVAVEQVVGIEPRAHGPGFRRQSETEVKTERLTRTSTWGK